MECQKHLFSLRPDVHYLNCAYKAPLLKSAEAAAIQALIRERNPMDIGVDDFFREVTEVKHLFGRIVNCSSESIALIPSVSYGFSTVLNNISPKKGGKAITIKDEFPSGYFSLKRWCATNDNDLLVIAPDNRLEKLGQNWNERLFYAIDDETSIVLLSSVHWMNGLKFDLKQIGEKCKKVGALLLVDGTQSVGALPMDVEAYGIDTLICAGYKWLLGPYSTGCAYISDRFAEGTPLDESWMNRTNARNFSSLTTYEQEYNPRAGRYNVGETSNFILLPILKAGMMQILEWGVPNIQQYGKELIRPLVRFLEDKGVALEDEAYFSNHLFSLKLPPGTDMEQVKANLDKHHISVSLRGKHIRVAVNVFNDEADIQALIKAIS